MAIAPLFHDALLGRELPRAQRWLDNTDVDDVRVDPGMTQAAYLGWERGADISDPSLIDWDAPVDVEELYGYVLTAELPWTWTDADVMDEVVHDQAAPYAAYDVWVTVNGVPLGEWLATASLDEQHPDFVDADLLLGARPEQIPLVLDTDILVLLEDEAEELGVDLELVPGVLHGGSSRLADGWLLSLMWHDRHVRPLAGSEGRKVEPTSYGARKSVPRLRRHGQAWRKRLVHRALRRAGKEV